MVLIKLNILGYEKSNRKRMYSMYVGHRHCGCLITCIPTAVSSQIPHK